MLRWVVPLLVLGVLALSPHSAEACSCMPSTSVCNDLARVNTVLVGTVRDFVKVGSLDVDVTVDVQEVFIGSPGKTVRIAARGLGGSCDYAGYKRGEKMLIFGALYDGAMHVFLCSRTAPVSQAAADLAELRRLVKQGTATISGRVSVEGSTSRNNIEVRVAGTALVTRTDTDGLYHFELPAGRYTLTTPGDPLLLPRHDLPVEAVAGACVTHDITNRWNGRIRGTVRDINGKPMAGVLVQGASTSSRIPLAWDNPTQSWSPSTRSDAHGAYELGPFPPDTYRVAVSLPFSPREPYPPTIAPDIKLGPGQVVGGINLVVLPPLPTHKLTAHVTLTGPAGPREVEVVATERASSREYNRYAPTGDFTFIEVAGGTIDLRACIGDTGCVTKTVQLDRDRVVDLPIETHTITVRAIARPAATKWDWWRVEATTNQHSQLYGQARNEPFKLIGIAGNTVDLHACVLEPVLRQTELGCANTTVPFDHDLTINLPIPVSP